jgi:hypothetical protein
MSEHTPGPWKILRWADEKKGFIAIVNDATGAHICDVFPFGTRALAQSLAVHQANARLIAAAPDLLNGCNALLGLLQIVCIRDDVPSDIRRIFEGGNHRIEEARGAIAKATGAA